MAKKKVSPESAVRSLIVKKIKAMQKEYGKADSDYFAEVLIEYIHGMAARTAKRSGGLKGKAKKK